MKHSVAYDSKLVVAQALILEGCRAVTAGAAVGTKQQDTRSVFQSAREQSSKSGQTPTNHKWFFGNRTRRQHAAFFLIAYKKCRENHSELADAHGIAFVMALRLYNQMMADEVNRVISGERFNLLVGKGFNRNWRQITNGGTTGFQSDNAKVLGCRVCKTAHLVEAHYITYTCEACVD